MGPEVPSHIMTSMSIIGNPGSIPFSDSLGRFTKCLILLH